jgi:hypothetical protein
MGDAYEKNLGVLRRQHASNQQRRMVPRQDGRRWDRESCCRTGTEMAGVAKDK